MGLNGLDHAHVEDGDRVEDDPRDPEALRGGFAPREDDVGDEDVRRGLGDQGLDGGLDEMRRHVDLAGGDVVGGGEEVLDAVGEADFLGGELDGVDADVVAAGSVLVDGLVEELGVGRGGDDGHVLPT